MAKNGIWSILGLVAIIAVTLLAFPEYLEKIMMNKFYMMIGGLAAFLIAFVIWMKNSSNY